MEKEKSIIVVAKDGYNVLLDINKQTFMIDCHKAINLSEMFPPDVLEQCSSLQAHLRDGNLVYYKGEKLSEDPNDAQINKLHEIAEHQIEAQFSQHSGRADAFNIEIETASTVSDNMRKNIDARIEKNRADIVTQDNKLLKHLKTQATKVADPIYSSECMSEDDLHLKVTMDIDDKKFADIQKQSHEENLEKEEMAENTAKTEIDKQNLENKN